MSRDAGEEDGGKKEDEDGDEKRGDYHRAALTIADGVLAFLLVVLFVRAFLPSRPLKLPTGASSAGVVLLGVFGFACGAVLGARPSLVERCRGTVRARAVDGLLVLGILLVASLVVLPASGVDLSVRALVLGFVGVILVGAAPLVALGGDGDRGLLVRRGFAAVVDGVPALALWYASVWMVFPVIAGRGLSGATWGEIFGVVLVLFFWSTAVRIPFEAYDGRSLGKHLVGVRVVDEEGNAPGARAALVRNVLRPVDSLPFGYFVGTSYAAGGDGRRIGDAVAGTRVERDD